MNKKTTQPAPKMTPRPNPTKPAAKAPAPKAITMPTNPDSERNISVRAISNGHIIRESGSDKKGNYTSKETFSPTPPVIQMNTAPNFSYKPKGK